jgi:hypothetical protein
MCHQSNIFCILSNVCNCGFYNFLNKLEFFSLHNITISVFVLEIKCVFCDVRSKFANRGSAIHIATVLSESHCALTKGVGSVYTGLNRSLSAHRLSEHTVYKFTCAGVWYCAAVRVLIDIRRLVYLPNIRKCLSRPTFRVKYLEDGGTVIIQNVVNYSFNFIISRTR